MSLICIVDIFNSQKYMNLTAFKLSGFIVLPYILSQYKSLIISSAIKMILAYILYLGILALLFGHIFPWVDPTGLKAGRDIPQWRSVIHLGSYTLEIAATLYLALQFKNLNYILLAIKTVIAGALSSVFAALAESLLHFDFYHFFTSQAKVFIENRMKGFNYEPRGFGQTCVYGALFSLHLLQNSTVLYISIFLILVAALLTLTISTTALIILLAGLIFPLIFFIIRNKSQINYKNILITIGSLITLIFIGFKTIPQTKIDSISKHYKERAYLLQGIDIKTKLEVFDAAALSFFSDNPKYLLFGTGPGLISIPIGFKHIQKRDKAYYTTGLTALPHMGIFLLLSNGGISAILIWLSITILCLRDIKTKYHRQQKSIIMIAFFIFMTTSTLYLLQIRYIYHLGLAIGLSFTLKNPASDEHHLS